VVDLFVSFTIIFIKTSTLQMKWLKIIQIIAKETTISTGPALWVILKSKNPEGRKFIRQNNIGSYI